MIRFLFLNGKTCEQVKVKLHAVYKDNAISITTIRYWFNEFKRGRTSVFDEEPASRPIEVTTEDNNNNNFATNTRNRASPRTYSKLWSA